LETKIGTVEHIHRRQLREWEVRVRPKGAMCMRQYAHCCIHTLRDKLRLNGEESRQAEDRITVITLLSQRVLQ
jgi:hypothetical protein